ncbi:ATP-binding cassette domain-containing protein [Streptomyces tubbatahanensis]|uniref:ATP-binding cassette domain-containing protein n=1 Tax=Streptomyces tubbatahanensis TaxID=2923272 RepID=A0ABY3XLK1_9ACTN|nr:ATP-binding cassette domain-containing protein [Streptomyces tubbatahanensis]UNS95283.1 ATP-binding cassette domain-containing protein [Streptomyces tubbatahanensis]
MTGAGPGAGVGADARTSVGADAGELLRVRSLSARSRDGVTLLDGVSFVLAPGRALAVTGPSGSGKTTLGLAALGLDWPGIALGGRVLLGGAELVGASAAQRRAARAGLVAHLPQDPASVLDPVRRIGCTLRELARYAASGSARGRLRRSACEAAVHQALEAAAIPEGAGLLRRFPHQLSGGQQQRVALATALITRPRLLVLDEPTSGLDQDTAAVLTDRLRGIKEGGTALLLLTHDARLVAELADTTAVLERGRMVTPSGGPAPAPPSGRRHGRARSARAPEGVSAQEVTVRAGRHRAAPVLEGVSMAFPPGSRTALVGPSGSGKTTFGRALAGLTPASSGRIVVDGHVLPAALPGRDATQRRIVQYVHQDSRASFDEFRPVWGQLADTGRFLRGLPRAEAEAQARALARSLRLEDELLSRRPEALSGGQLQRAALIRGLLAHPRLLVCDEVTSALDSEGARLVLAALDEVSRAGGAVLLITHDTGIAQEWAETVHHVDSGRLVTAD